MKSNDIGIISSFKGLWLKVQKITTYVIESPQIVIRNIYNYFYNSTTVHNRTSTEPLIDYEQQYHNAQAQVQRLNKEVLSLKTIHEQHIKDTIKNHNDILETRKEYSKTDEAIAQKEELQNKYINLTTQIENLIMERDQQKQDIIKLKVQLKETLELTHLTETTKHV
jgi:predicted RNase H-like nuclease (RuvC/YqgF family)